MKTGLLEIQGELANADIVQTGGSLILNSATLSGDTYAGTLNVDNGGGGNVLYIQNGITAAGGVINLTSANYYNELTFLDTETFNNQSIRFGNSTGYDISITDTAGTLTLGPQAVATVQAKSANAGALVGNFINQGTVSAGTASGGVIIENGVFTNASTGTISIGNNSILDIVNQTSFVNAGLVSLGTNATLVVDSSVAGFVNTGAVSLGAGSTFDVRGSLGLSGLRLPGTGQHRDIRGGWHAESGRRHAGR